MLQDAIILQARSWKYESMKAESTSPQPESDVKEEAMYRKTSCIWTFKNMLFLKRFPLPECQSFLESQHHKLRKRLVKIELKCLVCIHNKYTQYKQNISQERMI